MDSLFPMDSSFYPSRRELVENEAPVPPNVGSTRKLGVVEVPVKDLEDMISDLRYLANRDDSWSVTFGDLAEKLYSYLPG